MEIEFLPLGRDDFEAILSFVAEDNLSASLRLAEQFERAFEHLSTYPLLGRIYAKEPFQKAGYRILSLSSFTIFYTIDSDIIIIHRILHQARDAKELL